MQTAAVLSSEEWKAALELDPELPTTEAGIRALADQLSGQASADPTLPPEVAGNIRHTCATVAAARLDRALANPELDPKLREAIQRPTLPGVGLPQAVVNTPHFTINYTAGTGVGQVPDRLAKDAGNDLETAFTAYSVYYGVSIVRPGAKCVVTFAEGVNFTKPDGTMQLSCGMFKLDDTNPLARRLVCFHEAFHLLQFVCGFDVTYNEWFLEGTATWAELVHGSDPSKPAVTGAEKLVAYWSNQTTPITNGKYTTLPFWINLVAVCAESAPAGQVIKDIITTYAARYPTPGKANVPQQVARCAAAYVTLEADVTIESLWVNWLAKMAQGNWNRAPDDQLVYPTIYNADSRALPAIAIPPLTLASDHQMVFKDPGNSWTSDGAVKAAVPFIALMQFQLNSSWPPLEYEATVNPKSFVGTIVEPLSIFEYEASNASSGVGPDVVSADVCIRTFHDPQSAVVYLVYVGEYDYSVQYEWSAMLRRRP